MAIQQLKVHGYRSFRDVCWQPGKLNLLVGPNGSGKSNLLRLLELISVSAKGRLASALKAGGIVPLLWDYRADSFDWTLRIDPVDSERHPVKDALTLELRLEHLRSTSSYQIAVDSLGNWTGYERGQKTSPYWIYTRDARRAMVYDQQAKNLVSFADPDPNESLLPQISDPRTNPIPTHTKKFLEGWGVYHDVHAERGSPMRSPVTTQYSKLVETDGSNLVSVLHTLYTENRDFKRQIDEGMRGGFGDQFEELVFQPASANQIQMAIQWKFNRRPHALPDLSDGTIRFLFLLTLLASPEPATLIAIDEPETGLHPSMLPIIAEYAAEAATRTQVVMTSHSPEFLDAFSNQEPHVTAMHWEAGESRVLPLEPSSIASWLEAYRLGRLFTSGDLDAIAGSPVDSIADFAERAKGMAPEDASLPISTNRD
jgi:predicted ATPase